MKKILISVAIIAVVATISVGATGAYYTANESVEGNTIITGDADLKVKAPEVNTWGNYPTDFLGTGDVYPGWSMTHEVELKNGSSADIAMALTAKLEFEHYNDNDNLRDVLEMKVYNEEQGIETERKTLEEWRKNDGEEYVGVLNKDEVKTLEVEFSFPTNGDQNDLQNAQIANFNLVFDGVQVTEVMNVTQNTSGNSIQTVLGYLMTGMLL